MATKKGLQKEETSVTEKKAKVAKPAVPAEPATEATGTEKKKRGPVPRGERRSIEELRTLQQGYRDEAEKLVAKYKATYEAKVADLEKEIEKILSGGEPLLEEIKKLKKKVTMIEYKITKRNEKAKTRKVRSVTKRALKISSDLSVDDKKILLQRLQEELLGNAGAEAPADPATPPTEPADPGAPPAEADATAA